MCQFETLEAVRKNIISKVRGRVKKDATLGNKVLDMVKKYKEEASNDMKEWNSHLKKRHDDLKPKGMKRKKSKDRKKSKKRRLPRLVQTRHLNRRKKRRRQANQTKKKVMMMMRRMKRRRKMKRMMSQEVTVIAVHCLYQAQVVSGRVLRATMTCGCTKNFLVLTVVQRRLCLMMIYKKCWEKYSMSISNRKANHG